MPQICSRNSEGKKVLDWSKSNQADNIKMDFEDVFVNVQCRDFLEKAMKYRLPLKGMLISLQNMGDLPLEIKYALCNTILSPSVVVTVCTICCNINKT